MFKEYVSIFNGKPVLKFDHKVNSLDTTKAYRLTTEEDKSFKEILVLFLSMPNVSEIEALIFGWWDGDVVIMEIYAQLIANKNLLPNLKYLMLGDVLTEECWTSELFQGDIDKVLAAFPQLTHFVVRGRTTHFKLDNLKHNSLKSLVIQTTYLSDEILVEVLQADLPALEHLELWLGNQDPYDYEPIYSYTELFSGKLFPKLKSLSFRNSILIDLVAEELINAPILNQLEALSLSGSELTDRGGQAILDNPQINNLKLLNLRYHYLSLEMEQKIKALLGERVNVEESRIDKSSIRYIEVGE